MASPQASQHFLARNKVEMFDVDADYSTAAVVTATAKDMRDYSEYIVEVMTSVLSGTGITLVEIVAGSDSAVTSDITVIKTSGALLANAVGDYAVLSCTAEEIAQEAADADADLRYVALRLTMQGAGDEAVATVIRAGFKYGPSLDHTATYIS